MTRAFIGIAARAVPVLAVLAIRGRRGGFEDGETRPAQGGIDGEDTHVC